MAELRTLARPYARAVFAVGGDESFWSQGFDQLSQALQDERIKQLILGSHLSPDLVAQLLTSILDIDFSGSKFSNLILVLARQKRLLLLPEIGSLYEEMVLDARDTRVVDVTTAVSVDKETRDVLRETLARWMSGQMHIRWGEDPNILGGFIARSRDIAIDASIAGRLNGLSKNLTRSF